MTAGVNGDISFWYGDLGGVPAHRAPLDGDTQCDVAIVGAGYTGLWTAYYLMKSDPGLRVVILEKEFAGFGASGRNGGWLSGEMGWSREHYAERTGRQSVIDLQSAMWATVDEVIDVCQREGIDADIVKGGSLHVATTPSQASRVRHHVEEEARWGVASPDLVYLDKSETAARIDIADIHCASFTPHAARIQPAKLVQGLARVVEELGARICERTTVTEISPHRVVTDQGVVNAEYIIRATEGFTAGIKGYRREWLPMNSAMIATEPLSSEQWAQIGWAGYETLGDAAHGYMYAQRTREGRIAIGGRGIPYRFGSATDINGRTQERTVDMLEEILVRMFPALAGTRIDHAWCGVLGVPRDWCATVGLDPKTGIGWAGGYVGMGVATSNLAARTLRSLVLEQNGAAGEFPESGLPWVNRRVRRWEPEPLRWLGVHGLYTLFRSADRSERRRGTARTSRAASWAGRIAGLD
ncbi:MAG: NAD(P)/FAD-dependent oxidoreductase [Actinomycetes bacterium]